MHVNKVSYVFTINHVAQMLGEDEETLEAIAETMIPEDGCLFVVGSAEHAIRAFTKFGIESLRDLLLDTRK